MILARSIALSPGKMRPTIPPCPGRSAAHSSSRSGALQSRGRNERQCLVRSRFCEAALRESYALHRARDTIADDDNLYHPTAGTAGIGSAVTDLIFSIANREVTFFKLTAPI